MTLMSLDFKRSSTQDSILSSDIFYLYIRAKRSGDHFLSIDESKDEQRWRRRVLSIDGCRSFDFDLTMKNERKISLHSFLVTVLVDTAGLFFLICFNTISSCLCLCLCVCVCNVMIRWNISLHLRFFFSQLISARQHTYLHMAMNERPSECHHIYSGNNRERKKNDVFCALLDRERERKYCWRVWKEKEREEREKEKEHVMKTHERSFFLRFSRNL